MQCGICNPPCMAVLRRSGDETGSTTRSCPMGTRLPPRTWAIPRRPIPPIGSDPFQQHRIRVGIGVPDRRHVDQPGLAVAGEESSEQAREVDRAIIEAAALVSEREESALDLMPVHSLPTVESPGKQNPV